MDTELEETDALEVKDLKVGDKYYYKDTNGKDKIGTLLRFGKCRPDVHLIEGIPIDLNEGLTHWFVLKNSKGQRRHFSIPYSGVRKK